MCVACPGFPVICHSCPGIYQLGLYNYIVICLYNAVFAVLRRFIIVVDKYRLNTLQTI
nr:MAG TPA: hypothetical protein [Caudoviricetes sp.]